MNGIKNTVIYNMYIYYLKTKLIIIGILAKKSKWIKKSYIKRKFYKKIGCQIDFKDLPKTFNQKIQFRKLYDKNPLYSICSDKYRVRKYVKEKIGKEYLIPLYLVTNKLTEENWNDLPNQCVIKANHNSGPVQVVYDKTKANKRKIIAEINRQLKEDYGLISFENFYSDIKPLVVVEKLLIDEENQILIDYKFNCFNNKGVFNAVVEVIRRESATSKAESNSYDMDWNPLNYTNAILDETIRQKPKNFKLMKNLAKILSEDFDYVRVDFYNINGEIYFGELTFCDSSGFGKFNPPEWDEKLGSYWDQKIIR